MTRARCGRASGRPSRSIASWKPPRTRSAPSFHHSGSATSNSQRLSAAAPSLATSIMPAAPVRKGLRSSPPSKGRASLARRFLAFFVLHCTKHRLPRANCGAAAPSDGGNAKFEHGIEVNDPRTAVRRAALHRRLRSADRRHYRPTRHHRRPELQSSLDKNWGNVKVRQYRQAVHRRFFLPQ